MDYLEKIIPQVGEHVGRYEIVSELGRGGFGVVFRARQTGLNVDVAIKVMLPVTNGHAQAMQLYERFVQEAEVIKALDHPAAIKVRDFGRTEGGLPYLVMEFVPGRTLDRVLVEDGPLPPHRLVRIAKQVLGCLAEAHHRGIIHRDLKPPNIMVRDIYGEKDSVKVLDFGIAKVLGPESGVHTQTGLRFGTPQYMSPEQAKGRANLDGRLDLYAFGLILAECASGQVVVDCTEPIAAVVRHASSEEHPFDAAVMASPLYPVIATACRKDPAHRYSDALAMREAVEQVELNLSFAGMAARSSASMPVPGSPATGPLSGASSYPAPPQTPLPRPLSPPSRSTGSVAPSGAQSASAERPAGAAPSGAHAEPARARRGLIIGLIALFATAAGVAGAVALVTLGGDAPAQPATQETPAAWQTDPSAIPSEQERVLLQAEMAAEQAIAENARVAEADLAAQPVGEPLADPHGVPAPTDPTPVGADSAGPPQDLLVGLDQAAALAIVRSHQTAIAGCQPAQPGRSGHANVVFRIGPTGTVDWTRLGGSDLEAPVADCVVRQFQLMVFPAPPGGELVVTYPLALDGPTRY